MKIRRFRAVLKCKWFTTAAVHVHEEMTNFINFLLVRLNVWELSPRYNLNL